MAFERYRPRKTYDIQGIKVELNPLPIVIDRAPTTSDRAEIGTMWIDQSGNDIYVMMEIVAGNSSWVSIGGGAGTFDSVASTTYVTAGTYVQAATTVTGGTGLVATTGSVTCSAMTTAGVITNTGAGLFQSSTGTDGQLLIDATAGAPTWANITAGAGISVTNAANSITITATGATAVQYTCDDANVVVPDGAGNVNVVGGTNCGSVGAVANTVTINVDNAPTFTGLITGQLGLDISGATAVLTAATDAADTIYLHADAGTSETIRLHADQGTGVGSVTLESDVGGLTLLSGLASDDAINITATNGGVDVDAALQINIASSENATDAIVINSSAGGIDITSAGAAGEDIDITASSSINVVSNENAAQSIYLHANGGVNETVDIHSDQGTGAASVYIHSDVGGVTIDSTLASADAINIGASNAAGGVDIDSGTGGFIVDTTGAVSLDAALASNLTVTTAANDLTLESTAGTVIVNAGEDAADAIYLHADGGTSETIRLHADQGTGAASVHLESDVGGITLTSTGLASDDAINLSAVAGGVDIDGAMQVNIASSEDANDSIVVSSTDGGIDITAAGTDAGDDINLGSARAIIAATTGDIAQAIYLHANGGTSETVQLHADQGTATTSVYLLSDDGGITLESTALASDDAINLSAVAGGVDIDGAMQVNIASSEDANDSIVVSSTDGGIDITAAGTDAGDDVDISSAREINLVSTLDGAECIYLHANGGTSESIDLHADQGTGTDSIQLSSDVGGITFTSTGLASDDAINLEAVAGGVDIDAGMHIDIQTTEDENDAMALIATQGGIDITAQGNDAGDDIDINSTQDIHYTSTVDMTYTVGGIYDVNGTGAVTIDSSGGAISIGADADAQAINIGTGAAARVITIGNNTGATDVHITSGTGDITLTSTDDVTLTVTGDTSIDSATIDLNATGGALSATPGTATVAGVATTLNARVGRVLFTGQTPAAAATIDFDVTNSFAAAGKTILLTMAYSGAADCDITIEGVNLATAGHIIVHCKNNGPAQGNGDIQMSWWILD